MKIEMVRNFKYRIQAGDTLDLICIRFNTQKEKIMRNNPNIDLYVGEWVEISRNEFLTHIVKPTETLVQLAQKYNTTESELLHFNDLADKHLYIGQHLKIKTHELE